MTLPEKWLAVDPGEDTGWSVWSSADFVVSGTDKMWLFGDAVWAEALRQRDQAAGSDPLIAPELDHLQEALRGISLMVVENWNLYPWVAKTGALDFDECRTARLIGSLYQACRLVGWDYQQQSAKIKERALAAGAETYFMHPLHENRHANDSCLHGVYYVVTHASDQS